MSRSEIHESCALFKKETLPGIGECRWKKKLKPELTVSNLLLCLKPPSFLPSWAGCTPAVLMVRLTTSCVHPFQLTSLDSSTPEWLGNLGGFCRLSTGWEIEFEWSLCSITNFADDYCVKQHHCIFSPEISNMKWIRFYGVWAMYLWFFLFFPKRFCEVEVKIEW